MRAPKPGFLSDLGGATTIEYGLIACILALAIIGVFQAFGTSLGTMFTTIAGNLPRDIQ